MGMVYVTMCADRPVIDTFDSLDSNMNPLLSWHPVSHCHVTLWGQRCQTTLTEMTISYYSTCRAEAKTPKRLLNKFQKWKVAPLNFVAGHNRLLKLHFKLLVFVHLFTCHSNGAPPSQQTALVGGREWVLYIQTDVLWSWRLLVQCSSFRVYHRVKT